MAAQAELYSVLPKVGTIRLLEITDASARPLEACLKTTTFDDAPPYHALSYTWGSGKRSHAIKLNGINFKITGGLHAALSQLGSYSQGSSKQTQDQTGGPEVRYIWIDQICINQDDISERGYQVRQMDRVYSNSERTIVWLGTDSGFARLAVSMLRQIERIYLQESSSKDGIRKFISVPTSQGIDWERHARLGLPATTSTSWQAMAKLFKFPWYRRVWIIQEIVMSPADPVMLCGDVQCSWSTLSWAAHWLSKYGYNFGFVPRSVNCIDTLLRLRLQDNDYHLDALLVLGQNYYSTDPRDKINALLSLEKPALRSIRGNSLAISPDYSLSVSTAYMRATRNIIKSTQSLSLLSLPTRRLPGSWDFYRCFGQQAFWEDRPSWLPHFEDVPRPRAFVNYMYKESQAAWSLQYQVPHAEAVQDAAFYLDPTYPDSVLAVRGVRFDTVRICLEARPWHGLAEQHKTPASPKSLSLWERTKYYYKDCRHVGTFRLFLHLLDGFLAAFRRPLVLRMWELALEWGRYECPVDAARAVHCASTAGVDASCNAWNPEDVTQIRDLISEMHKRWSPRRRSQRLANANQELANYVSDQKATCGERFATAIQSWGALRRFFVTNEGFLGIGPSSMQSGDVVCVLFGAGVPVVLRPKRDGHWLFVGECYVHDVGESEAVQSCLKGDSPSELFKID